MKKSNKPETRYDVSTPMVMHYGVPETFRPMPKWPIEDTTSKEIDVQPNLMNELKKIKVPTELNGEKIRKTAEKLAEAIKVAAEANDKVAQLRAELADLVKL